MGSLDNKKLKRKHRLNLFVAIILCFLVLGLLGFPLAFGYYFKDRFFPRTIVAGMDVSRMTLNEARNVVANKFDNYDDKKININLVDKEYQFTLQQMGIDYHWREVLNDVFQDQRTLSMWQDGLALVEDLITQKEYNEPAVLTVQRDKISSNIDDILKEVNKEPVEALIQVKDNKLVISQDSVGIGVEKEELEGFLYKNLKTNANLQNWRNLNLVFAASELKPKNSQIDLEPVKIQAENLIKKPINMTFENKTYTFNEKIMIKWLRFNEINNKIQPTIDQKAVMKDVALLAKKINITPIEKRLSSVDAKVFQEGKDGRELNQSKLVTEILAVLNVNEQSQDEIVFVQPGQSGSIVAGINSDTINQDYAIALEVNLKSFATKTTLPPFTPNLYPGKYIEINLSNQRMYLWEGQNKIKESIISSGSRVYATPTGVFKIKNKAPRAWSAKYRLYMPFWMGVVGGVGIHELPEWPNGRKEGTASLGRAVSHGCIRLGVGPAKYIYNWTEVGIPVYIHK